MTHPLRQRLVPVALAGLAALAVAAAPAIATDDPAPRPTPGGATAPGATAPGGTAAPATGGPTPGSTPGTARVRNVRVRVRYRKRGACGGVRISVSGAGLKGVRRVAIRAGGRRIANDRSRPFRMAIGPRRLRSNRRIQIRLIGAGPARTITRRLRGCSTRRHVSGHAGAFEPIPVALALDALLSRLARTPN